jgi:hypothetical protein
VKRMWVPVAGEELLRADFAKEMKDELPTGSAVYAWRRKFRVPDNAYSDPQALVDWIALTLKTPTAIVSEKSLSHYMQLHRLTIGGKPLTSDKIETLKNWSQDIASRRWIIDTVQSISDLVPPLYVGETDNLARRITEHIRGKTQFSSTLSEKLNLDWKDCTLVYCRLPDSFIDANPDARRTLIELIVSRLTIAASTSRPG